METSVNIMCLIVVFNPLLGHCKTIIDAAANYKSCRGEPTGVSNIVPEAAQHLISCALENKYCQYRCLLFEFKVIDRNTLRVDNKEFENVVSQINEFSAKTELISKIKECFQNVRFTATEKCRTTRAFVYCVKNIFKTVCRIADMQTVDVNKPSEEDLGLEGLPIPELGL